MLCPSRVGPPWLSFFGYSTHPCNQKQDSGRRAARPWPRDCKSNVRSAVTGPSRKREYVWFALIIGTIATAVWLARRHEGALTAFIERRPVPGLIVYLLLNI